MPYVSRNRSTGQIAAGFMKNVYQITYYGAWWWKNEEEAEADLEADLAELGLEDAGQWELLAVTEQKLKILNVRLNNDPRRAVYVDDSGRVTTAPREQGRNPADA